MLTVPLTDSKRKNRNGKRPSRTRTNIRWTPTLDRGLTCPPPRKLNEPEGRTSVRLRSISQEGRVWRLTGDLPMRPAEPLSLTVPLPNEPRIEIPNASAVIERTGVLGEDCGD